MNDSPNTPENYELELNPEQRAHLQSWIAANFVKSDQYWTVHSYFLKHVFEKSEQGFYLTNGAFKGAMLAAGFDAHDQSDQNWIFNIRQNQGLVDDYMGYRSSTKTGKMITR